MRHGGNERIVAKRSVALMVGKLRVKRRVLDPSALFLSLAMVDVAYMTLVHL